MWDNQVLALIQGYGADIACGMSACPKATHLVDIHPEVLRRYQSTHTVHLFDANDGFDSWKDNLFDFTVCKNALSEFFEPKFIVDEMLRVTKPGGKVIVHSPEYHDALVAACSGKGIPYHEITDMYDQTFLFITVEQNKQYFIPKHVVSLDNAKVRHREFNRKSLWPIYVNPPSKDKYSRVSIVIATYGQIKLTIDCIDSILKYAPDSEIIIVDNGSPDNTLEKLKAYKDQIKVIPLGENLGCAGAWNIGLKEASGDLLGVLNNDTTVYENGVQFLASEAWRVGIACWHAGIVLPDLSFAGHSGTGNGTDFPNGCALFFRRDVFEDVGPFDDEMRPGYSEDSEWGFRAKTKGYGWAVCPKVLFHHHESTAKTVPGIVEARKRNFERLCNKWKGKGAGERILIRRWAAIGDVLMTTPALAAYRKKKPLAHIHLQCHPTIIPLLDGIDSVDVVSDKLGTDYTDAIDLDGAYEAYRNRNEWIHPTQAYAEILGVQPENMYYEAAPTKDLDDWVKKVALRRKEKKKCIALVPRSAGRPSTNWSEAKWVELVQKFPQHIFVVLDGAIQPSLEVHSPYKGPRLHLEPNVIDMTGKTPTIKHAMAILRHCDACVGVDTGITQMANAAQIPLVLLIGATAGWARAPLKGNNRVLQGAAPCYPCTVVGACPRTDIPHCLSVVSPDMVAHNLQGILE